MKLLKPIYNAETKEIYNIRIVYLIVAIVMLILALINYLIFGLEGGRYPELGSALGFQGSSWFIVTGFFRVKTNFKLFIQY